MAQDDLKGNIERIKSNLSIDSVLSEYIKLERSGSSYKARCPFHNEKTPSFYVSPEKGIYKCFGCGKSGDIFSFVEEYEGVDFKDSLKKLASKAGVSLGQYNSEKNSKQSELKKNLEDIHTQTAFFWQQQLYKNPEAIAYLKNRGIKKQTLIDFKIGLAPNDWNKTFQYLQSKGFSDQEILASGIAKKNQSGKIYDRFRNRIIFPLFSSVGKVIAFSGRDLGNSEYGPKYLNSPSTVLFDKSKELYGFNFAKNQIRKQKYVIVTEGQFDIVLSHQNNFINTVASSGTSITKDHLQKIKTFSSNIIFAFDSDKAGIASAFRGSKIAIEQGFTIKIAKIPKGKDPADILSEESIKNSGVSGKAHWAKIISSARDFLVFFSEKILTENISFEQKVKRMEKEILPLIKGIKDPIILEKYLKRIADGFGVSVNSVSLAMENISSENINISGEKNNQGREIKNKFSKEEVRKRGDHDQGKAINVLEKKVKSTIIWDNKRSKILQRIAKIYFLQEKTPKEERQLDINYIQERFLEFLPQEKFQDFLDTHREMIHSSSWSFEDILIEENMLKNEIDQLFSDLLVIVKHIQVDELKEELRRVQFLGDAKESQNIIKKIMELNQ